MPFVKKYGNMTVVLALIIIMHEIVVSQSLMNIARERKSENPGKTGYYYFISSLTDYWKIKEYERGKGFKPYKRTEEFWNGRLGDNDSTPDCIKLFNEYTEKYSNPKKKDKSHC